MKNSLQRVLFRLLVNRKRTSPTRVIAVGFLLIILCGALLLTLPCASKSGESLGFFTALFTATSATCVTGLVLVDTLTGWTLFGQIVILALIQVGGLGFMTIITIFSFAANRRVGLRERLLIAESLSLNEMEGAVRLIRHVVTGTACIELVGAAILACCFAGDFSPGAALWRGIFHSVSAFCNAGFDLMGGFNSLVEYVDSPVVVLTVCALIIVGGLGFGVWEDFYKNRGRLRRMGMYSKLVFIITGVLVFGGMAFFFAAEYSNPATMGDMSLGDRLLAALFQSVTTRTAGFNTIDQTSLTDASKFGSIVLMFIGGSSGSTAGGVKTVTVGVLLLNALAVMRGRPHLVVFKREIPQESVLNAATLVLIALVLTTAGATAISMIDGLPFLDSLFETVSAYATVGLSSGVTAQTSLVSRMILIAFMFFGRVGFMTVALALLMRGRGSGDIRYPSVKILIG